MQQVFNILRTLILLTNFAVCTAQIPDLVVQRSHTNRISSVAISPDNRIFATGSIDNSIRIWELSTGKLLKVINFKDNPNTLAFNEDGKYLYAGGYGINGDHIQVFDTKSWEVKGTKMSGGIMDIKFSDDHNYMGMATSLGYITIWENEGTDFKDYYQFTDPSQSSTQFSFSNGNDLIVSGGSGFNEFYALQVWSLDKNEVVYQIAMDNGVESAVFINQDKFLMVETRNWSRANNISIIDWKNNKVVAELQGNSPMLLAKDKKILFSDKNNQLVIRDLNNLQKDERIFEWKDKERVSAMTVDHTGQFVIAVSNDIVVYDLKNNKLLYRIERDSWTESMSFSPRGNQFSFGTKNGSIINWNLQTGGLENLEGHSREVLDMFYNTQGTLLSSVARDSTVIIWDAANNNVKYTHQFNDNDFHATSINPSGEWIAVSLADTVYSFFSGTGKIETRFSFTRKNEVTGDTMRIVQDQLIYSPNNRDFAGIASNYVFVYDVIDGEYRWQHGVKSGSFESISFSSDGSFIAAGGYSDTLLIYDLNNGRIKKKIVYPEGLYPLSLAFSPVEDVLAVGLNNGQIQLWDVSLGKEIVTLVGHANLINELSFREDGQVLASSSWDGNLILWNVPKREQLCTLYAFNDKTWAVIDPQGRYDASQGGNNDHLHFVVNSEEVIALNQLKERYYEPGLLQKLLGFSSEKLRDVSRLSSVALFPSASMEINENKLLISLTERAGGIGTTSLFINDKEISSDIVPNGELKFETDLEKYAKYFISNTNNRIAIITRNEQGYLQSEKIEVDYFYKEAENSKKNGFQFGVVKPKMYAIVIGTSDYRGKTLDLQFADKDAHYMADAIVSAGEALLGIGNVEVKLLTTDSEESIPNKSKVAETFELLANKANAEDILVFYLSGHGVNYGGQDGQFYYLTHAVESGDISDEIIRENYTISTAELTEWINKIPAKKQVLILDACASGKAIEDIQVQQKAVSSSQVRALERLKDRTGMFVIAGSAADKVSYEASQFGQSLLTYSLLSGMKGQALREKEFVDVMQLFQYAVEEVPNLAKNIGGVQKPVMSIPYGGSSFDIGRITEDVDIKLEQIKPVFIRTNFQEEFAFDDVLNLSGKVDNKFKDIAVSAKSGQLIFVDVAKYPSAFSIKGRYQINGNKIALSARVFKDNEVIGNVELDGSKEGIDALVTKIIEAASEFVK